MSTEFLLQVIELGNVWAWSEPAVTVQDAFVKFPKYLMSLDSSTVEICPVYYGKPSDTYEKLLYFTAKCEKFYHKKWNIVQENTYLILKCFSPKTKYSTRIGKSFYPNRYKIPKNTVAYEIVFKNGPSKICGMHPLKNLSWYGLV